MLLVLDNCEHVIEAAAALAVDTLRGAGRAGSTTAEVSKNEYHGQRGRTSCSSFLRAY